MKGRAACPCCGFPTLSARGDYDICELCNWEDDGRGEAGSDEDVSGGPNGSCSLAEARASFKRYRVMYVPGHDTRLSGDSELTFQTKGLLMAAFEALASCAPEERVSHEREVLRLETVLRAELTSKIEAYEARLHDRS